MAGTRRRVVGVAWQLVRGCRLTPRRPTALTDARWASYAQETKIRMCPNRLVTIMIAVRDFFLLMSPICRRKPRPPLLRFNPHWHFFAAHSWHPHSPLKRSLAVRVEYTSVISCRPKRVQQPRIWSSLTVSLSHINIYYSFPVHRMTSDCIC